MAAPLQDAVRLEHRKTGQGAEHSGRIRPMPASDRADVDSEVAHRPFDQIGAQPVVGCQGVALDRRKASGADPRRVLSETDRILDVAMRQTADRGRPEADQRIRRVRRVALEIPAKPSLPLRDHHRIGRVGIVVQADPPISSLLQRGSDRFRLGEPGLAIR